MSDVDLSLGRVGTDPGARLLLRAPGFDDHRADAFRAPYALQVAPGPAAHAVRQVIDLERRQVEALALQIAPELREHGYLMVGTW